MSSSPTPWYKQFWPWFLITIPLISMILSLTMVTLAINTKDSMVIDDYYKEGRSINLQLAKYQEAKAQNIQTKLNVAGQRVSLTFSSGLPSSGEALELKFHHATLIDNDFAMLLTRDAAGVYRGVMEKPINGNWKISLLPLDQRWKILNNVTFPLATEIEFNP